VALRIKSQPFGHDGSVKVNGELWNSEQRFIAAEQNR
jgi:hypothetical protein